jgi:hypothetical protein
MSSYAGEEWCYRTICRLNCRIHLHLNDRIYIYMNRCTFPGTSVSLSANVHTRSGIDGSRYGSLGMSSNVFADVDYLLDANEHSRSTAVVRKDYLL